MGRTKKHPIQLVDNTATVMNIDAIEEKVAFVKINRLYPRCVDVSGMADLKKVREVVRGIWIASEHVREAEYLFAVYRGHVAGVFHVTAVSKELPIAYRTGLLDFPTFPEDVRECDRWKARFASTAQARHTLNSSQYVRFLESLKRPNTTPDHVLELDRRRIYFSVNEQIPQSLITFVGCRIQRTGGLGGRILADKFRPIITNF